MNLASPVSLAYFGKIASRGDFVRSSQQVTLTETIDQWLSQGLERVSMASRWKQRYDQLGDCRFAFIGVQNKVALVGHLVPSVDAAGRRFPFVIAGSFEVQAAPLTFMALAPMALSPAWARLQGLGQAVCAADDATALLARLTQTHLEIDTPATSCAASFVAFLDQQTVGSLEALLRASHPRLELRRSLLALGLLLQPLPASGVSRIDKGLALPLPDDLRTAAIVGAFWMSLVTPFLASGSFEVALFMVRPQVGAGSVLRIGFSGGDPACLQSVFDPDAQDEAFVDIVAADWVEADVGADTATRKLSSYLMQPQLSIRQAMRTFQECFFGGMKNVQG